MSYRRGSTSRAAFGHMTKTGRARSQRERVVMFVWERAAFGATREEIAVGLGMRIQSVCPAVAAELLPKTTADGEILLDARLRVTDMLRKTASGRMAEVLQATAPWQLRQGDLLSEGARA